MSKGSLDDKHDLPTPRTDEAEVYYSDIVSGQAVGLYWVPVGFAAQLERELAHMAELAAGKVKHTQRLERELAKEVELRVAAQAETADKCRVIGELQTRTPPSASVARTLVEHWREAKDYPKSEFVVPLAFARQLERELAATTAKLEEWKGLAERSQEREERLIEERNEALASLSDARRFTPSAIKPFGERDRDREQESIDEVSRVADLVAETQPKWSTHLKRVLMAAMVLRIQESNSPSFKQPSTNAAPQAPATPRLSTPGPSESPDSANGERELSHGDVSRQPCERDSGGTPAAAASAVTSSELRIYHLLHSVREKWSAMRARYERIGSNHHNEMPGDWPVEVVMTMDELRSLASIPVSATRQIKEGQ